MFSPKNNQVLEFLKYHNVYQEDIEEYNYVGLEGAWEAPSSSLLRMNLSFLFLGLDCGGGYQFLQ